MIKELFYDFYGYNQKIFCWINDAFNDQIFQLIFLILDSILQYYCLAIYLLLILVIKFFRYNRENSLSMFNYELLPKFLYQRKNFYLEIIYIYVFFLACFTILKYSMNMPRPLCILPNEMFNSIIDLSSIRCNSSFPSAHSGLALIICYLLWEYFSLNRIEKIASIFFVIFVGISRIGLAMHFPTDVLFGYIFAIISILCGKYISKKLIN